MPVAEARQLEYLERLRERNRLRWELQQRTADQQRSAIRQREAGFDLFLSGANAERIKGKKASQQMRAAATQGVTAPEGLRQHLETRGRWQQQTIALLASDGTQLCARPCASCSRTFSRTFSLRRSSCSDGSRRCGHGESGG